MRLNIEGIFNLNLIHFSARIDSLIASVGMNDCALLIMKNELNAGWLDSSDLLFQPYNNPDEWVDNEWSSSLSIDRINSLTAGTEINADPSFPSKEIPNSTSLPYGRHRVGRCGRIFIDQHVSFDYMKQIFVNESNSYFDSTQKIVFETEIVSTAKQNEAFNRFKNQWCMTDILKFGSKYTPVNLLDSSKYKTFANFISY